MAFCTKCGATLEPNAQFCASCGAPVDNVQSTAPPTWSSSPSTPPPPPTYASPAPMQMNRPTGITILAVLAILGGLAELGFGLIFSLFGFGLIFVVFGLIELAVAYGFWTGASWGWWLGMIGAVLDLISIVTFDVIGFIIGIVMLYYLTRPHVKMWFHKA